MVVPNFLRGVDKVSYLIIWMCCMNKVTWLFLLSLSVNANDIVTLQTFTVTALRDDEKSLNQALSISKKEQEETQLDQVVFQKDLLNSLSGVNITQTGSVVGHMTSVRTPVTTSPYFLFLQDGIAVQSSGFFNHNALAYTNFESASSVEVLKGAGTALYGSDAVAGTLNIQSKAPSKTLKSSLRFQSGSNDFYRGFAEVSTPINNSQSFRVGAGLTKSRGWREHTAYERFEANGRYDITLDSDNFMKITFNITQTDAEQAGALLSLDELHNSAESVGDIESLIESGEDPRRQFDFGRAALEWNNYSIDVIEISNIVYARYNRNRYTATWENNLPHNDAAQRSVGLLHKDSYESDYFTLIVGFDSEYTRATQLYTQGFDYVPSKYGSKVDAGTIYDYDVDYLAIAPYIHTDITLFKEVHLIAGLRYDYNKFDYTNNTNDGRYGESNYYRPSDRSDDFSHLSPKVSLQYSIMDSFNAYIRYANGFRIPQASRLYSAKVKKSNNIPFTLEPETSNTFEVGTKKGFSHSYIEIALYLMSIDNTITRFRDDAGDEYYDNAGSSVHKGVELSYFQKISGEFNTKLSYTYSLHNFVDDEEFANNILSNAPEHQANMRLFYLPSYLNGFRVMGELEYISEYWMDNENEHSYDGYTVGNIKADYTITPTLELFAKINNVSDEKYAQRATFSYGKEKYTPASPREFFMGLDYTW